MVSDRNWLKAKSLLVVSSVRYQCFVEKELAASVHNMVYVQEIPPSAWIFRILLGLFGFAITSRLLRSEIKKRRLPTTHFSSKYLRIASAVCFWCGPISPALLICSVIPGFCMMRFIGSTMTFYTQILFLSFYQLSRLHYCFSNQQLHAKKGYPFWVFILMVIIGINLWISGLMLHIFVDTLPSKCGFTNDISFFYQFRARAIMFDGDSWEDEWMAEMYYSWNFLQSLSGHIWDLVILLLYLFKIWRIGKAHKSKENRVWENVLFILHRIVIITVFYTICSLLVSMLYTTLGMIELSENTVTDSILIELRSSGMIAAYNLLYFFSILLMMDHNTNIYVVFLRFLHRFRLKYICFCCCYKMVDKQMERWNEPKEMELQPRDRVELESTMFPNLSVNIVYTSDVSPKELREMSWEPSSVTHIVSDNVK